MCWGILWWSGLYWGVLELTGACQGELGCTGVYWSVVSWGVLGGDWDVPGCIVDCGRPVWRVLGAAGAPGHLPRPRCPPQKMTHRERAATSRSRGDKSRPATAATAAAGAAVAPGCLTEAEWLWLLAAERGDGVVGDILEELVGRVMDVCSRAHVARQVGAQSPAPGGRGGPAGTAGAQGWLCCSVCPSRWAGPGTSSSVSPSGTSRRGMRGTRTPRRGMALGGRTRSPSPWPRTPGHRALCPSVCPRTTER